MSARPTARPAPPPQRQVLLGEMCPEAAAGRAGVLPLVVRKIGWSSSREEAEEPIRRGEARQFSVLAWDGRRAGLFTVVGLASLADDVRAATGGYAGVSPCVGPPGEGDAARITFQACVEAQAHCGLAVAELEPAGGDTARPFGEDPAPLDLAPGGGCVSDGKLLVDVDGDGRVEAFDAADFLDPVRAPSTEVTAVSAEGATCEPAFAQRHILPPEDPRHWRGLDLIGVLDLDLDGRKELVLAYQYADRRTWAVYSALGTAGRLELAGEAEVWPR